MADSLNQIESEMDDGQELEPMNSQSKAHFNSLGFVQPKGIKMMNKNVEGTLGYELNEFEENFDSLLSAFPHAPQKSKEMI